MPAPRAEVGDWYRYTSGDLFEVVAVDETTACLRAVRDFRAEQLQVGARKVHQAAVHRLCEPGEHQSERDQLGARARIGKRQREEERGRPGATLQPEDEAGIRID